tara:strand:- start:10901 stop:12889 length:1989 start_codon:yes stop_codon:yes gene_type:complete
MTEYLDLPSQRKLEYLSTRLYPENYLYNFEGDFFTCWLRWRDNRGRAINTLRKAGNRLLQFLKHDIYAYFINKHRKQHRAIRQVVAEIDHLLEELDELYTQSNSATGFPESRILKEGNRKFQRLRQRMDTLYRFVQYIRSDYPKNIQEKIEDLKEWCPYLVSEDPTREDYEALAELEKENFFTSRLFYQIWNFLMYMCKIKFTPSSLLPLVRRLQDPEQHRIFFINVARFRKIFAYTRYRLEDEKREERIRRAKICQYRDEYPIEADMFFDSEFFAVCEAFLFISRQYNFIDDKKDVEKSNKKRYYRLISFYYRLRDNRQNNKPLRNATFTDAVKLMVNSRIYIENTLLKLKYSVKILFSLTPVLVNILVKFGIKKIHNLEELRLFLMLRGTCHRFYTYIVTNLAEKWYTVVDVTCRDLYHLTKFIRIYRDGSERIFDHVAKIGYQLTSADLNDIDVMLSKDSDMNYKEAIDIAKQNSANKNRKLVLLIGPKSDHNAAFDRLYEQLRSLPKDKFAVHFAYVRQASQLAYTIEKVANRRKIDYLFVAGHGWDQGLTLDVGDLYGAPQDPRDYPRSSDSDYLTPEQLQDECFDDTHKHFSRHALCYLMSCSTGKGEDNLANAVAKRFKVPTFGARDINSSTIVVRHNNELEIQYTADSAMFSPE